MFRNSHINFLSRERTVFNVFVNRVREEQAMSRHRVTLPPFLSSSSHTPQHNNTTQTVTHTVTLTSASYNTVQILFTHVMWSAQAVHDSKIDHT